MSNRITSNTCLAMVKDDKGKLWFAGDRRISWGMHKALMTPRPKITKRNGVLLAGTGTSAVCDLVTDLMPIPRNEDNLEPFDYMHKTFMPELLRFLREEDWVEEKKREISHADEDFGATIVIGVGEDLFELTLGNEGIHVDIINTPYAAGCGGYYALGSLLTTEKLKMKPRERLKLALQVAAHMSPGCDDNIDILHN